MNALIAKNTSIESKIDFLYFGLFSLFGNIKNDADINVFTCKIPNMAQFFKSQMQANKLS